MFLSFDPNRVVEEVNAAPRAPRWKSEKELRVST